jgi:peroxiredoxin Q/BCP
LNAEVLGVSGDSVASHKKFTDKYGLPFTLLADEKKEVIGLYGIAARTSFLIDPQSKIAKIYENVKPEKHAEEVLADISRM